MSGSRLTRADMLRLFELLDAELAAVEVTGELYLVGGAVMCLALDAREATRDIDALFRPAGVVREAARRVAAQAEVAEDWLNDAVKGFLGSRGEYEPFLDLDHLKVFVARPTYLLAMKCAAMRLGEEFHDIEDVRYLLRALNLTTVEEALAVVTQYFAEERLPAKTRLALEELLGDG